MDTHIFTSLDEFFYTQAYTTSLTKDSKIMASKNIKHNYTGTVTSQAGVGAKKLCGHADFMQYSTSLRASKSYVLGPHST